MDSVFKRGSPFNILKWNTKYFPSLVILVFSVWSNSRMFGRPWKPSARRCQGNTNVLSWDEAVTAPQQGQTSQGAFKLRVIASSNQKKKEKKTQAPPKSYRSICSRSRQSEQGGFPHLLIKHQIGLSTPLPTPRWRERRLGRFKRGSDWSKDRVADDLSCRFILSFPLFIWWEKPF